jgi:potassium voltage-gated channel Eag-related subfamily H protein 1/potassium voltage-gated channel Eag-related subfamily H protein 5
MITVGFGDISPVNYKEIIVVGLIEIISSIVLAYNISEVGSIVSSIRKNSEALERKLGVLRRMMAKNPVPE